MVKLENDGIFHGEVRLPLPEDEKNARESAGSEGQSERDQVTDLLVAWSQGESMALDDLMARVYREMKELAGALFRVESAHHTLQPTALVHEAFLRLVHQNRIEWQSRAQFFAVAGCLMRRILVDYARAKVTEKRGGGAIRVTLPDAVGVGDLEPEQMLQLSDALDRLGDLDPQQAKVVEARYFAGMTIAETSAALKISPATVKREWTSARAWLLAQMTVKRS